MSLPFTSGLAISSLALPKPAIANYYGVNVFPSAIKTPQPLLSLSVLTLPSILSSAFFRATLLSLITTTFSRSDRYDANCLPPLCSGS